MSNTSGGSGIVCPHCSALNWNPQRIACSVCKEILPHYPYKPEPADYLDRNPDRAGPPGPLAEVRTPRVKIRSSS